MRSIYPTYLFKDHDPIIDKVMTLIAAARVPYAEIAASSRVSVSTLRNWDKRKTKRPQFATVAAVVVALGKTLDIRNGKR